MTTVAELEGTVRAQEEAIEELRDRLAEAEASIASVEETVAGARPIPDDAIHFTRDGETAWLAADSDQVEHYEELGWEREVGE